MQVPDNDNAINYKTNADSILRTSQPFKGYF